MNKDKCKKYLPVALFCIYIVVVLWITLIKRRIGNSRVTLTPFWEYVMVIKNVNRSFFIKQILGNLLMLMPFGFLIPFLPKLHDINLKKIMLGALCFSVFIELTQFITHRGWLEFDDVFNNTVGAGIGYGVYKVIIRIIDTKFKNRA